MAALAVEVLTVKQVCQGAGVSSADQCGLQPLQIDLHHVLVDRLRIGGYYVIVIVTPSLRLPCLASRKHFPARFLTTLPLANAKEVH
jgi:hypothetical protein